jgi:hypothetical protein
MDHYRTISRNLNKPLWQMLQGNVQTALDMLFLPFSLCADIQHDRWFSFGELLS